MSWDGKIAVITGASSGIGAATAQLLASRGLKVMMVARRQERLTQLEAIIHKQGGRATSIQADLTSEEQRRMVFEQVLEQDGQVDVLVNNAGFGWYGYGADMPWKTAQEMLQLNINAVVHLSLEFLRKMRDANWGHIINIGSIAGSFPNQGVAVYSATKAFMDAFTTALYRETYGSSVRVSVVRAGPVSTEFFDTAAAQPDGRRIPAERFAVPVEKVARGVWEVLQRPRRVLYVPGWMGIVPWVEGGFGWLIDRLGPLLLQRGR